MNPALILASASPRRRQLLADHGYAAQVCPADVTESEAAWLTARELVLLNARRKCRAVAGAHPHDVTLGVDTLVSLDGAALGKPRDLDHAHAMLTRLSGREHQVYTGVCLAQGTGAARQVSFVEETTVRFLNLTADRIRAYHALVNPLDKAGGYGAQERHEMIIQEVVGSWSNVLGLPMERLRETLGAVFGIYPAGAGLLSAGLSMLGPT